MNIKINDSVWIYDVDIQIKQGLFGGRPIIHFRSEREYPDYKGKMWKFGPGDYSDGHSIPQAGEAVFDTLDEAAFAAFIHDEEIKDTTFKERLKADKNYRKNLRYYGSPWWVQWTKYFGVVIGSIIYTGFK